MEDSITEPIWKEEAANFSIEFASMPPDFCVWKDG